MTDSIPRLAVADETTELLGTGSAEADSSATIEIMAEEAKRLAGASTPVIASYVLQYGFGFISLVFVGRIGADELAAAALANMALVVAVYSPGVGLASALDTFCSTAFTASPDQTLVGFHLQRGLIAAASLAAAAVPVLWYLEPLLLLLRQDPAVAALCGMYTRIQLLGVLPWLFFECVKRFLQAQGIMHASTYVLVAVTPVHLAGSYFLTISPRLGAGMAGAAAANALTNWLLLTGIVAYVRWSKAWAAWGGWSAQALWAMPQYLYLAVPSTIMVCAEWWILDLLALAASYLGSVPLAAQSIIINTCSIAYQVPDGLSMAVCNRVGNLIGQAQPRRAKLAAWLGISLGAAVGAAAFCAGLAVRGWWGRVYSDDRQVAACVAAIMPACAAFQMLDSVNSVGSGVLRSLGRQNAGAAINFSAYYAIGFPLGLYLTYGAPRAGLVGLWYGLCAGVALAVACQLLLCVRIRWRTEVDRCQALVSRDRELQAGA
ncbi:ethionine resistance protein [Coemansia spiralis]|nr:ethionine resistance protein [Coemansia spiralis]